MLPPNHPLTRHVRRVVINILESSDLGTLRSDGPAPITTKSPDGDVWGGDVFREDSHSELVPGSGGREWNLLVVNDPKMINAMATVGNIVVFTGILPICKDEQGLAAVLSHEIGHVVARHISERYSSTKVLLFIALLLQASGLDFGVGKLATHLLLELPNSRTQETEADTIGMRLASKACYDPKAAVDVHVRLSEFEKMAGGSSGAEFLRTHPGAERRIKHLQELLPEGYSIRAGSSDCGGMQDSVDRFISAAQYYSFRQ
ncbi:hypothetical protein SERLADRAFT_471477 [Serpula lacrymans var. lacrymans S7.9]|nr:uncharacterized protein SERLADRAFT_471477 [Serpula lacrymans var. lacrymans S7.9]EGO22941.1 hypothetical protein SERLADRAFT_471477 [Serpula lacrymans var. lacrymans S7.9]